MPANTQLIIDDLLEDLVTIRQAHHWISAIEHLDACLYNAQQTWGEKLNACLSLRQQDLIHSVLERFQIPLSDPASVGKTLVTLKQQIKELPAVTIYTALDVPHNYWLDITRELYQTHHRRVLIDALVDQSIIGGIVLVWQGRKSDFSTSFEIDAWLKQYFINR